MRDRKAFEEDAFGKLWQADTCYLPHITEDGKTRRVYCMMIIDDHSRMLVGGGLFYNDNAYNFRKCLSLPYPDTAFRPNFMSTTVRLIPTSSFP